MDKILIIDDDKAYAETLKIVLSESFKNVDYVTLAKEGLNYVLSESPDVVITDLKMPEINGLEVLRRIKEIDNTIAVLIITAFDTDRAIKACDT